MRTLPIVAAALLAVLLPCSTGFAGPGDPRPVSLELTYPAGTSPRVFTKGWVFGARCVVAPGTAGEQDVSAQVSWSGTGTFTPAKGSVSRPAFTGAGPNRITLAVTVDKRKVQKSWDVNAVDPSRPPRYAKVGDQARAESYALGCPACPHAVQGPIISGSPSVTIGGLPAARKGDVGESPGGCGPSKFEILEGDPTVLIDGRPAARVGHKTDHSAGIGKIIGPGKGYYAVFAPSQLKLKEGRKPNLPKDATHAQRVAAFARLTLADFDHKPPKPDAKPLILRLEGGALATHPKKKMTAGSRWALYLSGTYKDEKRSVPFAGAILLTLRGAYEGVDALKEAERSVTDQKLAKAPVFDGRAPTVKIVQNGQTFTLGPLEEGWSEKAKTAAVKLMLSVLPYFDCFIAHAVYARPDAVEVNAFRGFRERVLRRSAEGRRLIRLYEEHGPDLAMDVRGTTTLKPVVRHYLDRLAAWVKTLDLEDEQTLHELDLLVRCADALVACVWKEGAGRGAGRLVRILAPLGLR